MRWSNAEERERVTRRGSSNSALLWLFSDFLFRILPKADAWTIGRATYELDPSIPKTGDYGFRGVTLISRDAE